MERDELFAKLWQPERVESGYLDIALPNLVGINEELTFGQYRASLKPSGREVNFGLGYAYALDRQTRVSIELILSKDSGHIRSESISPAALASLRTTF
jgi:hypothetical protein